jgi:hypothetical protein
MGVGGGVLKIQVLWIVRARSVESESEEILAGVGVGKNILTPTPSPTSI